MTTHIGFRAVYGDLTSSHGYRWPWPGKTARAPLPDGKQYSKGDPCPQFVGDGICIAKTFAGATAGGIPAHTCLIVEWDERDVLGEDEHKLRVRKARVLDVIDLPLLARSGVLTEEQRKNLQSADLQSANLRSANLRSADLQYANLQSANLQYANLRYADLQSANLQYANLRYANLRYARNVSLPLGWIQRDDGIVMPT